MHNLDEIIKIYLSYVPVQEILNGKIEYKNFPQMEFERLSKAYLTCYSDTENGNLYQYIAGSNRIEGHPYAGIADRSGLNVFAALEELAAQLLIMEENVVLCKYPELLRFRNVSNFIEEDLLVCAFLVARGRRYFESQQYKNLGWDTTIMHNNVQLRGMLREGISENHFHLYGSAPTFQLMWLHFMNHLPDRDEARELKAIGEKPRIGRNHYYIGYQEEGYERSILKAALIRIFLFTYLLGEDFLELQRVLFGYRMKSLLVNEECIEDYRYEIQRAIGFIKSYLAVLYGAEALDYALYQVDSGIDENASAHGCFAGERWFIYEMLKREVQEDGMDENYFQWFYAYLVIKNHFRREILQTNETVGFENFRIFTKRKGLYHDNRKMAVMAVRSSILTANLHSLEIRIPIKDSAVEDAEIIGYYDTLFGLKALEENPAVEKNVYYVFDFHKREDEFCAKIQEAHCMPALEREELAYQVRRCCRHYKLRKRLNRQANELQKFRECYPEKAKRVLGIDACSQEIGCRPEVFAPAFRFLAEHVVCDLPDSEVSQLKMTYHVGEDFLDVADGLRAVDEAIYFLNLQCGDRIGHGTVLGIDVHKWYEFKRNTIVLPQQDYLDNIVWMHHKLVEFKITGCEELQHYLLEQYDTYFSKIYLPVAQENNAAYSIHSYYEA